MDYTAERASAAGSGASSYSDQSRILPDQMTILTTNSCSAKCAHCLVSASPKRSDTLQYNEIVAAIQAAHDAKRLSVVVFAGGEPTELGESLLDAIAYTSSLGIGTRLVTNASWATDSRRAVEVVSALRESGLDEINFSADDFHLPFIPLQNVVTAWWACKGRGFQSVVIALSSGPGSKLGPAQMMEALGEKVPVTYDDDGNLMSLPLPNADGTVYIIANNNVYRIGRGRRLKEAYVSYPKHQEDLERPCPWAVRSASLSPRNHLVACCGIEAEGNEVLDFGSIGESSIHELVDRANADPLVVAISVLGPRHLMRRAKAADPDLVFRAQYSAICEICEDVTTNPRAVAVLRANSAGLQSDIVAAQVFRLLGAGDAGRQAPAAGSANAREVTGDS